MNGKSVAKLQQEKRKVEGNLHHKSFQGHSFKVVRVLVVELQVVMKDEGGLHVQWHLEPNRCCTWLRDNCQVAGMGSSHLSGPST